MHPMFVTLFIETDADELLTEAITQQQAALPDSVQGSLPAKR
jgi:hypothetical protein